MVGSEWGEMILGYFVCQDEDSGSIRKESLYQIPRNLSSGLVDRCSDKLYCIKDKQNASMPGGGWFFFDLADSSNGQTKPEKVSDVEV